MASNPDFVQYIVDQCGGAGDIEAKKMFGDYCLYCTTRHCVANCDKGGKPFGLVCDNGFYVKPTEAGRALLRHVDMRPPYECAKPYFYIEDVDDRDYLSALVKATCAELQDPKPKKKK